MSCVACYELVGWMPDHVRHGCGVGDIVVLPASHWLLSRNDDTLFPMRLWRRVITAGSVG